MAAADDWLESVGRNVPVRPNWANVGGAAHVEVLGDLLFVEEAVVATAYSGIFSHAICASRLKTGEKLHQLLIIPPVLFSTIRT